MVLKNGRQQPDERTLKMKKMIAFCLLAVAMLSFSGCASAPQSLSDAVKVADMDSKYGLTQMCKDLREKEYIPEEGVQMKADVIGAQVGYRFTTEFNSSAITLELYEFDTKNLNNDAKDIISQVEKDGQFNMLDFSMVPATMSDNGKYMMIYRDNKITGDNPDEQNVQRKEDVTKIFNSAE